MKNTNNNDAGTQDAGTQEAGTQEASAKVKKPIFKKWWFWVLVVVVVLGAGSAIGGGESSQSTGGTTKAGNVTIVNGTVSPSKPQAGDMVTITASNIKDKAFNGWQIVEGQVTLADPASAETTFTMGEEKVSIEALYRDPDKHTNEGKDSYKKYPVSDVSLSRSYSIDYINGTLVNNSGKDLSYVQIEFTCFDKDGNVIGTAYDNQSSLPAGKSWKFKAMGMYSGNCASYEFADISAW